MKTGDWEEAYNIMYNYWHIQYARWRSLEAIYLHLSHPHNPGSQHTAAIIITCWDPGLWGCVCLLMMYVFIYICLRTCGECLHVYPYALCVNWHFASLFLVGGVRQLRSFYQQKCYLERLAGLSNCFVERWRQPNLFSSHGGIFFMYMYYIKTHRCWTLET